MIFLIPDSNFKIILQHVGSNIQEETGNLHLIPRRILGLKMFSTELHRESTWEYVYSLRERGQTQGFSSGNSLRNFGHLRKEGGSKHRRSKQRGVGLLWCLSG